MHIYMYQWCGFKSRRGENKNVTALKSNSNTVWFNFQTYIYKTENEMTKAIITTECTLHSIYKFTNSDFSCEIGYNF
jgi:hypothetical protein